VSLTYGLLYLLVGVLLCRTLLELLDLLLLGLESLFAAIFSLSAADSRLFWGEYFLKDEKF